LFFKEGLKEKEHAWTGVYADESKVAD